MPQCEWGQGMAGEHASWSEWALETVSDSEPLPEYWLWRLTDCVSAYVRASLGTVLLAPPLHAPSERSTQSPALPSLPQDPYPRSIPMVESLSFLLKSVRSVSVLIRLSS